jgi:hypothetical protein
MQASQAVQSQCTYWCWPEQLHFGHCLRLFVFIEVLRGRSMSMYCSCLSSSHGFEWGMALCMLLGDVGER